MSAEMNLYFDIGDGLFVTWDPNRLMGALVWRELTESYQFPEVFHNPVELLDKVREVTNPTSPNHVVLEYLRVRLNANHSNVPWMNFSAIYG